MSDAPVNLNKVRKNRTRAAKKALADENSARFGRTRAQKEAEEAAHARHRAHLDAHRREEED